MINRKSFMVHIVALALSSVAMSSVAVECPPNCIPYARPAPDKRTFRSEAVDRALAALAARIADPQLRRMFEACYPNTLDTTVRNDGYVITGDIDAMWLRDSGQQMWPYLRFAKERDARALHDEMIALAPLLRREEKWTPEEPDFAPTLEKVVRPLRPGASAARERGRGCADESRREMSAEVVCTTPQREFSACYNSISRAGRSPSMSFDFKGDK